MTTVASQELFRYYISEEDWPAGRRIVAAIEAEAVAAERADCGRKVRDVARAIRDTEIPEAVAARNAEIAAAVRGLEVLHHNTSPQFWYPGPPPEPDEWLHRAAVLAIVEKGLDTRA